jgi:hypothetical protein
MMTRLRPSSIGMTTRRAALTAMLLVAAILMGPGPTPAAAHHGWSGYDSSTLLTVSGTILDVQYGNPHVLVSLEVPSEPEEDGTIEDPPTVLQIVMAPPSRSESRGLARDMLTPGVTATYEGYLHHTESMELRAERIHIGDLTVELR